MRIYPWLLLKRKIEEVLMWPFIAYGKWLEKKSDNANPYDLFVFIPDYALGGAEKVHADIIRCFPDKRIMLFFTRKSVNDGMLALFQWPNVHIQDISAFTDNKLRYWQSFIWRGRCATRMNRQSRPPVMFNGQCNFGYKLYPHLNEHIRKVELIHVSEKKFSWITFPFISYIHCRITVARQVRDEIISFYREIGIPVEFSGRFKVIPNQTEIPSSVPDRQYLGKLKIGYAGRGGYQKRLPLLFEVARRCVRQGLPFEFHFAGGFDDELPSDFGDWGIFHGKIEAGNAMQQFLQQMDILFMLSAFEGFPLVMMEAMAQGVVPVSTAVSGIPEHLHHEKNGLLLYERDEELLIAETIRQLKHLSDDRQALRQLSINSREYARTTFAGERFCQEYHEVLFGTTA